MALTRARRVAVSSDKFAEQLQSYLIQAVSQSRDDLDMLPDISEMLNRTRVVKPATSIWDIKNAVGGLRDMEYLAQTLWLKNRDVSSLSWPKSTADMLTLLGDAHFGERHPDILNILAHYHRVQQWQSLLDLPVDADFSALFEGQLKPHIVAKNTTSKTDLTLAMKKVECEVDRLFDH